MTKIIKVTVAANYHKERMIEAAEAKAISMGIPKTAVLKVVDFWRDLETNNMKFVISAEYGRKHGRAFVKAVRKYRRHAYEPYGGKR